MAQVLCSAVGGGLKTGVIQSKTDTGFIHLAPSAGRQQMI